MHNFGSGNSTLFTGEFPADYTAVLVNDMLGYQIEYSSINAVVPGFEFNQETDYEMYLQFLGNAVLLCIGEKGPRLLLGRSSNCI